MKSHLPAATLFFIAAPNFLHHTAKKELIPI